MQSQYYDREGDVVSLPVEHPKHWSLVEENLLAATLCSSPPNSQNLERSLSFKLAYDSFTPGSDRGDHLRL